MRSVIRRIANDPVPVLLVLLMGITWTGLHLVTGIPFAGTSAYKSYTLQAMAWREGHTWVNNLSYLELAVYEGRYYVSFPPLPSVVLFPLTFLFGWDTPDNLLVKLYTCTAVLMMYRALNNLGENRIRAAAWAFLSAFASSLLPLTLEGAVWYHAQVLAYGLITASIYFLTADRPAVSLLCYALSVACRPFDALYGILLIAVYSLICIREGKNVKYVIRRLRTGVIAGLCVAVMIGAYNAIRFGNPLEFGHNYLPEFSTQGGIQFSLAHVPKNAKVCFCGMPFSISDGKLSLNKFGFSVLIACPAILFLFIRFMIDLFRKNMNTERAVLFAVFLVHLLLILMHRTFGAYQFGARYCADLLPYAFFYRLIGKSDKPDPVTVGEWVWLIVIFGFTLYGSVAITL